MSRTVLVALIIAAFVFPAGGAVAQVTLGLGGGLSRIGISGDAPLDASWAARFAAFADLHVELDVSDDVGLVVEPGLQFRSSALEHTISTGTALAPSDTTVDSVYVNTAYWSLPVGIRVYSASRRWYFTTGAAAHLLQKIEIDTLDGVYEPDNVIQNYDVSVFLGGGYRIPIDQWSVCLEARYQQGLIDLISDDQQQTFHQAPVIRMSGLLFRASVEWRFAP